MLKRTVPQGRWQSMKEGWAPAERAVFLSIQPVSITLAPCGAWVFQRCWSKGSNVPKKLFCYTKIWSIVFYRLYRCIIHSLICSFTKYRHNWDNADLVLDHCNQVNVTIVQITWIFFSFPVHIKNYVYTIVKVTQSCLTLCNPMDYTVHGIL